MSSNWVQDIADMQDKFGIQEWMEDPANRDKLFEFLRFRIDFLEEEYKETIHAWTRKNLLMDILIYVLSQ